jgi:hypothetical protein
VPPAGALAAAVIVAGLLLAGVLLEAVLLAAGDLSAELLVLLSWQLWLGFCVALAGE